MRFHRNYDEYDPILKLTSKKCIKKKGTEQNYVSMKVPSLVGKLRNHSHHLPTQSKNFLWVQVFQLHASQHTSWGHHCHLFHSKSNFKCADPRSVNDRIFLHIAITFVLTIITKASTYLLDKQRSLETSMNSYHNQVQWLQ